MDEFQFLYRFILITSWLLFFLITEGQTYWALSMLESSYTGRLKSDTTFIKKNTALIHKNVIEMFVRCTIHCAVFVLIKLFVMLCEYLIKNWLSSWFAVGLLVHYCGFHLLNFLCFLCAFLLNFVHSEWKLSNHSFVTMEWPMSYSLWSWHWFL